MAMKKCPECGKSKLMSAFNRNRRMKDGLQRLCRECQNRRFVGWYAKDRRAILDRHRGTRKGVRERNRKLILEYLSTHPCADCGEMDPVVLDFDHSHGPKRLAVSAMVSSYSWKAVLAEIKKCDVRCANCHRRKTHKVRHRQ